jgi:hypothetical protein
MLPRALRRAVVSLLFLSAAPTVLVGCGGRGSAGAGQEPKPFALTATEDVAHRSSKRIQAASGGVVQAVDGQGTRYRLTIPAKALLTDTDIVVTPLSGIAAAAGQTIRYGVDLAPAGTRLYDFALLEIVPTSPLPANVYWLKTEGPPNRQLASPGAPAIGKPGMLLMHFSGGAVADLPAFQTKLSDSYINSSAFQNSTASFQAYRDAVQQDYQAGRLDQDTYEGRIKVADKWIEDAKVREVKEALARATEAARAALEKAESLADRGDLKDAQAIHDAVIEVLGVERQHQLLGTKTDVSSRIGVAYFKWYAALLRSCAAQHLDPKLLVGLERELQMLGYQSAPGSFEKCAQASGGEAVFAKYLTSGDDPDDYSIARVAAGERVQKAADRVATYASTIH